MSISTITFLDGSSRKRASTEVATLFHLYLDT